MNRWFLGLACSIAFAAVAHAHHSLWGVYDNSRQVTVEGIVAQFQFINPHPFLSLRAGTGTNGEEWRLELDNRSELAQIGMTRETLRPGDRIRVTGHPARDRSNGLYVISLDRPADGFGYEQVGTRPRIKGSSSRDR